MASQWKAMKARLDQHLAESGRFESRSRARDAIARGAVRVNGAVARKAGMTVSPGDRIEVADPAQSYVSRAALKLAEGLRLSGFSPRGRVALDIGASTGGFTQVLLEEGARRVFAVDVGHGQMAERLADDPRVNLMEGVNARRLRREHFGGSPIECITCDVSFISLKLALPPALALAAPGAWGLFLVKPQFEAGRAHLGGDGVIRDRDVVRKCAQDLAEWLDRQAGWHRAVLAESPIAGGEGNREFLLAGTKEAG